MKAGATLHQIVNLADLAPTFLDWMGAPAMGVDGRSLAPLLAAPAATGGRRRGSPTSSMGLGARGAVLAGGAHHPQSCNYPHLSLSDQWFAGCPRSRAPPC